jgi:uncharacterized membrane protein
MISPSASLDNRIVGTFSVVSLLIAVIAGYLAGIWPVIAQLLNKRRPNADDDAEEEARRCDAYKWGCRALTTASAAVALVMLPLVVDIFSAFHVGASVSPLRASVVLFAIFIFATVICSAVLGRRLNQKAHYFRAKRGKA